MEDKTERLRLMMADFLCDAIKDVEEYTKGLDGKEKLKVILKFLPYVCDIDDVKKILRQLIININQKDTEK